MEEIINQHRQLSEELALENAQLKEKATRSLSELIINTRNKTLKEVTVLIDNKDEIETLLKQLQSNTQQLSKQTKQWMTSIKKLEDTIVDLKNLDQVGQKMETELNEIDLAVRKLLLN